MRRAVGERSVCGGIIHPFRKSTVPAPQRHLLLLLFLWRLSPPPHSFLHTEQDTSGDPTPPLLDPWQATDPWTDRQAGRQTAGWPAGWAADLTLLAGLKAYISGRMYCASVKSVAESCCGCGWMGSACVVSCRVETWWWGCVFPAFHRSTGVCLSESMHDTRWYGRWRDAARAHGPRRGRSVCIGQQQ